MLLIGVMIGVVVVRRRARRHGSVGVVRMLLRRHRHASTSVMVNGIGSAVGTRRALGVMMLLCHSMMCIGHVLLRLLLVVVMMCVRMMVVLLSGGQSGVMCIHYLFWLGALDLHEFTLELMRLAKYSACAVHRCKSDETEAATSERVAVIHDDGVDNCAETLEVLAKLWFGDYWRNSTHEELTCAPLAVAVGGGLGTAVSSESVVLLLKLRAVGRDTTCSTLSTAVHSRWRAITRHSALNVDPTAIEVMLASEHSLDGVSIAISDESKAARDASALVAHNGDINELTEA